MARRREAKVLKVRANQAVAARPKKVNMERKEKAKGIKMYVKEDTIREVEGKRIGNKG